MFDLNRFIEDCDNRIGQKNNHKAVMDILSKAIESPNQLFDQFGEPTQGGIQKIYQSDKFSILNVVWTPNMSIMPHNHNMWAAIGVYSGREDNIFWRRLDNKENGKIPFITASARDLLLNHDWPGNVRELENTLQRALVLSGGNAIDNTSIMIDKSLSNITENLAVDSLADQLAFAKAT